MVLNQNDELILIHLAKLLEVLFDAFLTHEVETHTVLLHLKRPPCPKALVSATREGHSEVLISKKDGSQRRRREREGGWVAEENWTTDPGNARLRPRKAQTLRTWQGASNIFPTNDT